MGGGLLQTSKDTSGRTGTGRAAERMNKQIFNEVTPLRQSLIGQSEDFLSGNYDISQNPVFGAGKSGYESQYNNARQNILANAPAGGQLQDLLAQNEFSRASGLGNLGATIAANLQDQAMQLTGMGSTGLSNLTSLASAKAAAQATENAAKYGAMGNVGSSAMGK